VFTGAPPDVDRAMADVAGLMRQRRRGDAGQRRRAAPHGGPTHRRRDAGGVRLLRAAAAGRARAVGEPLAAAGPAVPTRP